MSSSDLAVNNASSSCLWVTRTKELIIKHPRWTVFIVGIISSVGAGLAVGYGYQDLYYGLYAAGGVVFVDGVILLVMANRGKAHPIAASPHSAANDGGPEVVDDDDEISENSSSSGSEASTPDSGSPRSTSGAGFATKDDNGTPRITIGKKIGGLKAFEAYVTQKKANMEPLSVRGAHTIFVGYSDGAPGNYYVNASADLTFAHILGAVAGVSAASYCKILINQEEQNLQSKIGDYVDPITKQSPGIIYMYVHLPDPLDQ